FVLVSNKFLVVQVSAQHLQEDQVGPAIFRVQQVTPSHVVIWMDTSAYQPFTLLEISIRSGQGVTIQECTDGVACSSSRSMVEAACSGTRQPRVTLIEPAKPAATAIVHRDHPVGQTDHCFSGEGVAR